MTDVIIIGSGAGGCAAAHALVQAGLEEVFGLLEIDAAQHLGPDHVQRHGDEREGDGDDGRHAVGAHEADQALGGAAEVVGRLGGHTGVRTLLGGCPSEEGGRRGDWPRAVCEALFEHRVGRRQSPDNPGVRTRRTRRRGPGGPLRT